jgi:WD40 repeat protein
MYFRRIVMRILTVLLSFTFYGLFVTSAQAQEKQDLAQKAKAILEAHCYKCHGQNGAVEGGMNYLLDRDQLVAHRKVVPGDAAKSRIIKRMVNEEMPPDEVKKRPTAEELNILKQWIVAGAPDFNPVRAKRSFISNADMQKTILKDLNGLPENDRRFTRYFTITHLHNAGQGDDELESYRQAISKLVNSLSWAKPVVVPKAVDAEKTIFRINLRDYKWTEKSWDLLEAHYPYGLLDLTELQHSCQMAAKTKLPYIRGDWFVSAAAAPPLYHDLLQLPTTAVALEQQLHVKVGQNINDGQVMRAGFNSSGVSRNNRLIERHDSIFGAYWKSYDFGGNTGNQNLFTSPTGPNSSPNSFHHDGGELIFNLPNGLQAYMLINAKGARIDKGPTEIVSDPKRPDRAVVNGLSCMSCHSRGIIIKEDQVRAHAEKNQHAFLKDELGTILALYPPKEKMQAAMEEDAERFSKAVAKTGCRLGTTEPVVALALRFEAEMDLALAAAELGLTLPEIQKHFQKSVTLARFLGPLTIEGGSVQRQVFTEGFSQICQDLQLGTVHVVAKINPKSPKKTDPDWISPKWDPDVAKDPKTKEPRPSTSISAPGHTYEEPLYFSLRSHQSAQLYAVAISPANKWIWAMESKIGIISLYDKRDGNMISHMSGHKSNVLYLDISPDGKTVASGSIDQTAKLWDAATGSLKHTLVGHSGFVYAVKFSPDGSAVATGSERLRFWDAKTGKEIVMFEKSAGWVEDLAFTFDGKCIATASKVVELWDAQAGKLLHTFGRPELAIQAVAVSAKGDIVAGGGADGTIHLWDLNTKKLLRTIEGHRLPITSLAFNPNGQLLISTSGGKRTASTEVGEFKCWDSQTGKELASQAGHNRGISFAAMAPDGRFAVSAGLDGHLRFRDLMFLGRTPLEPLEGHFLIVDAVALSRDGKLALTGSYDRSARLWDLTTGTQLLSFTNHNLPVTGVALTPDNKFAFTGSADKTLHKWDLKTGGEIKSWKFSAAVTKLHLSGNGKILAIGHNNPNLDIWDAEKGERIQIIQGADRCICVSHDGTLIAGSAPGKGLRIWETATSRQVGQIGTTNSRFTCAAMSPDGKQIVTGDADKNVSVWDVATGNLLRKFVGHKSEVRSVAFCDGGKRIIASGGEPKLTPTQTKFKSQPICVVFLWDGASGRELARWDTNPEVVGHMGVASDRPIAVFVTGERLQKIDLEAFLR